MRADDGGARAFPMAEVVRWYRDMALTWSAVEPSVHRQLLLCVQRWVLERVLLPLSHGEEPAVEDVRPTGSLVWALVGTVPPGEGDAWKTWIQLVLVELRRALARPPSRRTESWARLLFLIPYDIPYDLPTREGRERPGPLRRPRPASASRPVVTGER